jgi:long-chain acyl-CoA synthetase
MNIVNLIRKETERYGEHVAVVEGEHSITYDQLLDRIDATSHQLSMHGVSEGQRIAFRSADGIDYIVGALALLACGAAVVPVPDSVTADEVRDTIERIDVQGVLTHTDIPLLDGAADVIIDDFAWQSRPAGSQYDEPCRQLQAAFIRFSSGTTGESKGVVLSHQSIEDRTDAANAGLKVTHDDVILWVLGMSHHFVVSILLFLRKGATIIVANQGFPFSVLEAAKSYPITLIYGSPVHYYLLGVSNLIAPDALKHVRLAISTSMKMPPEVSTTFTDKFGFAPAEAYGIIEIGLPFINTEAGGAGKNTVGKVLPAYEVRIANADEHGVGEVLVKGKGMFDAYFSPWRLREECTDDGWFHTGDIGRVDEDGRLYLLGRSKTVIVCAGMKVFPEEVEEVINAAAGVRESIVFGKDHPQFGQVPVAHVVLKDDAADVLDNLRSHCIEHLSSYKVPVEFVAVESLPKTASGKLARAAFKPVANS